MNIDHIKANFYKYTYEQATVKFRKSFIEIVFRINYDEDVFELIETAIKVIIEESTHLNGTFSYNIVKKGRPGVGVITITPNLFMPLYRLLERGFNAKEE